MDRFTADAQVPPGLVARALVRVRRRKIAVRAALAAGTAAAAAAVIAATGGASGAPGPPAQAGTAAYLVQRVEDAVAGNHMVVRTETTFSTAFPAIVQWSYRGHLRSMQTGYMWLKGDPWAQGQVSFGLGTAAINGKLTYVPGNTVITGGTRRAAFP